MLVDLADESEGRQRSKLCCGLKAVVLSPTPLCCLLLTASSTERASKDVRWDGMFGCMTRSGSSGSQLVQRVPCSRSLAPKGVAVISVAVLDCSVFHPHPDDVGKQL